MTVNSNAALASHRENARIQCHPVKTLPGSSAGIHFAVLRPSVGSPGECLFFQLLDIMCKVEPSIYIYNVFRFSTLCTKHCFTSLSMIGYLRWKFRAFRFGFYFCHFLLHLLCSDFQWHLCVSFLSMSLLNHSSEKYIYVPSRTTIWQSFSALQQQQHISYLKSNICQFCRFRNLQILSGTMLIFF